MIQEKRGGDMEKFSGRHHREMILQACFHNKQPERAGAAFGLFDNDMLMLFYSSSCMTLS
jgi:hypothetical protein